MARTIQRYRLVPAALLTLVIAAALTAPAAGSTSSLDGLTLVTQFTTTTDSQLYVDDSARLVYELGTTSGKVTLRDADSYRVLGQVQLKAFVALAGKEAAAAVDPVHNLLFVASNPIDDIATPSVAVLHGPTRRALGNIRIDAPSSPTASRSVVKGLSYDATRNKLFAIMGGRLGAGVPLVPDVSLVQIDVASFHQSKPAVDWAYDMPYCSGLAPSLGGMPGVPADPARPFVYVLCTYPSPIYTTGPRPFQGIVRVPIAGGKPPASTDAVDLFRIAGDFPFGGALFDPVSERMFLATRNFGPEGEYVFDGRNNAVVGIIDKKNNVFGACIDRHTGRYYEAGDGSGEELRVGLSIGDIRPTPPDRGRAYPHLGRNPPGSLSPVGCDGVTRRFLVKYQPPDQPQIVKVFHDEVPPYPPAPTVDPDSYTHDIDDRQATTTVNFNGIGRAYGARVIDVGGPTAIQRNFINNGQLFAMVPGVPQLSGATRSLTLAPVGIGTHSVSLSDSSGAGAVAAGAVRDASTADSMQRTLQTGRDDEQFPEELKSGLPGDVWPYGLHACSRSPGQARETDADGAGDVAATCDVSNGASHGEARAQRLTGVVNVEGAHTRVDVRTDPEKGVVSTAAAEVARIEVPAIRLVLEGLTATATSSARGRPGTAHADYRRSLGRAVLGDTVLCDGDCDIQRVVDAINTLPVRNVRAELPSANSMLAAGTPRGAAAAIVRDTYEQLNDEVVNRTHPDDQQVPALRLVVSEDAYQHGAVVADFAAPEVATLRSLSPCQFCDNEPDGPIQSPELPKLDLPGGGTANDVLDRIITPTPMPPSLPRPPARPRGFFRQVGEGLRQVAAGIAAVLTDPSRIPLVAAVWSVLAIPVYLASRRRLLLSDEQVTPT